MPGRNRRFLGLLLFLVSSAALAQTPCVVPDNGSGTVDLPPDGCDYLSPADLHVIVNGLPAGTQINISPIHNRFLNPVVGPGGSLGGEVEQFQSTLELHMEGTGLLAGFTRTIFLPADAIVHTGPRTPGDAVQVFPNEMFQLQGELFGDPDFDLLRIQAGSSFGLPSPGQTTLTRLPSGDFNVDSFFDIDYRIEFQGAPGSALAGFSGTTTDTVHMQGGTEAPTVSPCVVPDDGTGTVSLPPAGCGYVSPTDLHAIIAGLPPGTQINIAPEHRRFTNITHTPGGSLGGEIEQFNSEVELQMSGSGDLAGYQRTLLVPLQCEVHSGPRTPGDPVQDFDTEMVSLQGAIFGDPDFDQLQIRAGASFGLPSPGHTTLTQQPSGNWNVDSFFDIEYQIDFQGAPGGALDGQSGTTTGTVRMQGGGPTGGCPPIAAGTDSFPSTATLVLQLFGPGSDPFVVRLSSADLPDTVVQRDPQVGDTIDTEIVALDLGSFHPQVGGIQVHLDPSQQSTGQISNIVQDPATCELIAADSFFDVWTEITVGATGQTLHTDRPIHLERKLTRLPPEDVQYENPYLDPIDLVDTDSGLVVGQILNEVHHVDPPFPPPGPICLDTILDMQLDLPGLGIFPVQAQGPITVQTGAPQRLGSCSVSGTACAFDADCPLGELCLLSSNQVQTEIVSMDLTGTSPLGPVLVNTRPTQPSPGSMSSQNPGTSTYAVDSFFDVFVDIQLPDQGQTLHNNDPVHVVAGPNGPSVGARNTPPDPQTPYQTEATAPPVPLLDENEVPAGQILQVNHIVDTPRDWAPPPPPDEDCFDSWVHLQVTIYNPFCQDDLWLRGHFRVLRDAPTSPWGPTIQETIQTLMAKAVFDGDSTCMGPLTLRMNPQETSSGTVSSLAPAEFFPADSFFDIFIEAETGIGRLHTQDPAHMTTTVSALPPDDGEIYYGPGTIIPLYDATGLQIGEILEVSHEVHEQIVCPPGCRSIITFPGPAFPGDPDAKDRLNVGIPGGGGGVLYDVVRGTFSSSGVEPADFPLAISLQTDGGPDLIDSSTPGTGYFYLARDGYGAYNSTWDSGGDTQQGSRDGAVP